MLPDFKLRGPLADDVGFITKTWGREIAMSRPHRADQRPVCPDRLFFPAFQNVMAALMQTAHARIIVPTTDASFIAGFVVAKAVPENKNIVVHFAYVRPPFRRLGLATAALEDMGYQKGFEIIATHWTKYMNRFEREDLIMNDFVLYEVKR